MRAIGRMSILRESTGQEAGKGDEKRRRLYTCILRGEAGVNKKEENFKRKGVIDVNCYKEVSKVCTQKKCIGFLQLGVGVRVVSLFCQRSLSGVAGLALIAVCGGGRE